MPSTGAGVVAGVEVAVVGAGEVDTAAGAAGVAAVAGGELTAFFEAPRLTSTLTRSSKIC